MRRRPLIQPLQHPGLTLLLVLALVGCAGSERRPRSGARGNQRRIAAIAAPAQASAPELAIPAPVAAGVQRYAAKRLMVVRDAEAVSDTEVIAIHAAGPCDAACMQDLADKVDANTLVRLEVARSGPDECTVSAQLVRPDGGKVPAPRSATSACHLQDLETAAEQAMHGFSELRGLATSPPPPHPQCENVCTARELSCNERSVLTCGDSDWDGCTDWLPTACAAGQGCSKGKCIADPAGMQFVGEGPFLMGSAAPEIGLAMQQCHARNYACVDSWWRVEQPAHFIQISGFWIDRTEVTNAEYEQCVRAGKCRPVDYRNCRTWDAQSKKWGTSTTIASQVGGAEKPVSCVSYDEAVAYCRFRGQRLPTEAEWEKAARGTDRRIYPWGNEPPDGTRANSCDKECGQIAGPGWRSEANLDDKAAYLAAVGSYPAGASPYGVLDMAGNVWEWVSDWYDENYYKISERRDPPGPESVDGEQLRVIRGGSWSNEPDSLRAAYRYSIDPGTHMSTIGFRCAYP